MAARILIILVSGILVDNFVLAKFLGICPFLGVSKKLDSAMGMSIAVTFVMVLATAATWPIYTFLLLPKGTHDLVKGVFVEVAERGAYIMGPEGEFIKAAEFTYLNTIIFILVIAALVQLVEIVLKKFIPALHRSLGVYLPLITTNCAVLGVTILNIDEGYNFLESIINSLGAGLGFMLAMVLFAGVRSRMESCKITKSFDGIPITLVAASIVSLAFMGFGGVVEGIFGA